ncbi:MAG: TetR family transcriptional regulator [Deltaproteobacteria bacterium]
MARPRSDISPRIVRAARVRFLHEGVDGASQRHIARDAGTSLGMVYYYFPTKDLLFLAVVEDVYAEVVSDLEQMLGNDVPAEERLRRILVRFAALSDAEVDVLRIVVREALVSNARRRQILERFLRGHVGQLLRTVFDGISSGAFRPIDPPFFIVAAMVGVGLVPHVIRRVVGPGVEPFTQVPTGEQFADLALDVLLRGIGGPQSRVGAAPHKPIGAEPAASERESESREAPAKQRTKKPRATKKPAVKKPAVKR